MDIFFFFYKLISISSIYQKGKSKYKKYKINYNNKDFYFY